MLILEQCSEAMQLCYNMRFVWKILNVIIKIVQWSIPVVLIVLGTLDMFKAMTKADDEKAVASARNGFIKRLIYGVVIFLVPFLVSTILSFVESNLLNNSEDDYGGAMAWLACWEHIGDENETFFKNKGCRDIYKKYTYNCKCIFKRDSNGNVDDNESVFLTVNSKTQCENACKSNGSGTSDYKFHNTDVAKDYENYLKKKKGSSEQSGTEGESDQLDEGQQYCYEYTDYGCPSGMKYDPGTGNCISMIKFFTTRDNPSHFKINNGEVNWYGIEDNDCSPYNVLEKDNIYTDQNGICVCSNSYEYNVLGEDYEIDASTCRNECKNNGFSNYKFDEKGILVYNCYTKAIDGNRTIKYASKAPSYTDDGTYKVYICNTSKSCDQLIGANNCNTGQEKTIP